MKNILIIGAKSDIAIATARQYAQPGVALILAARDTEQMQDLARDLEIRGATKVELLELDVAEIESRAKFIRNFTSPVEGIIIACGYLGDQIEAQNDDAEHQRILDTNFLGVSHLLNALANRLEQQGHGFIIGITSVAGDRGRKSNYVYGAAKAAFSAYLSGLRNRLYSAGVQVLEVKPGFVNTKMTQGLDLPPPLTAEADQVGQAIFKAQSKGKDIIYVKPIWRIIMLVIRNIPEMVFKRLSL